MLKVDWSRSKQTNRQVNKQAGEQADKQICKKVSKHACKQKLALAMVAVVALLMLFLTLAACVQTDSKPSESTGIAGSGSTGVLEDTTADDIDRESEAKKSMEEARMANPRVEVADLAEVNAKLGTHIVLPKEAIDLSFYVITNECGEVDFTINDTVFVLRAQNFGVPVVSQSSSGSATGGAPGSVTVDDVSIRSDIAQAISGIYESFAIAETHAINRAGETTTLVIDVSQSGIKRALWTWGEATYCMIATGSMPVSELLSLVENSLQAS